MSRSLVVGPDRLRGRWSRIGCDRLSYGTCLVGEAREASADAALVVVQLADYAASRVGLRVDPLLVGVLAPLEIELPSLLPLPRGESGCPEGCRALGCCLQFSSIWSRL